MTLTRSRTVAASVALLLIGGFFAVVGLNIGAATGPDRSRADERFNARIDRTDSADRSPKRIATGPALVERMVEGMKAGRRVRSPDNPVTGVVVPVVKGNEDVPVGSLNIPAMGLRTPFFEGVHDAVIDNGPGHWPGTPLPGQRGNSVLSGHRTTHGAEFGSLDVLRRGDQIRVQVGGAERPTTYVVQDTTIVRQSRYVPFVLRQPVAARARQITLFACDPVYASTHRIVVRAEAKRPGPSTVTRAG